MEKINLIQCTLFLTILISGSLSLPTTPDISSFVVSSTEPPKEATTSKNDVPRSVPKIYEMRVDSNITNRFATTLVTSKVKNLAKTAQEATFAVVLPDKAYITGFIMEIEGKEYKAYIKEKEEAKQIYDEAVQSGQAAAHVELSARDSSRFTVSVNVEPQTKAVFKLTYEELLQRQSGQYELVVNIHPGQPVKDLSVQVNINETRAIVFVKSPPLRTGNELSKNDDNLQSLADIAILNETTATVKFQPDIARQLLLATGLGTEKENGLAGQFVVQYDVDRDPQGGDILIKDGYFVHFFAPQELTVLPKQVVFVLDTSGSMGGTRIEQLKQAMNNIIEELKPEDVFNIVEFNSVVKVWDVKLMNVTFEHGENPWDPSPKTNKSEQILPPAFAATKENKENALKVVAKLNAEGGTDIKSGLEIGLKLVKVHQESKDINSNITEQPMIIFLTDGEPTVGEGDLNKIVSAIQEYDSVFKAPIFSLSFGDGADRDFLQKISLKNYGFARHIYEAGDASLQLQNFYRDISSPLLRDVNFTYVSKVEKLSKTDFPLYLSGSELVVTGRIEEPNEEFVVPLICGVGREGLIKLQPKIETPVGDMERLWAYLTVKQILEERDAADNKTSFTKRALDLALKYSFVTAVSSLVVVKPNSTKAVNTEDASKPAAAPYPLYQANVHTKVQSLFVLGPTTHRYGGFGFTTNRLVSTPYMAPSSFDSISKSGGYAGVPAAYPIPLNQPIPIYDLDSIATVETAQTEVDSSYSDIKTQLPWINDILSENGTLSSPPGNYKLSTIGDTVTIRPECPKVPINGTAGICTLLPQCPQVFNLLTDEKVFEEYFCPLDNFVGICCPIIASVP